MAVESTFVLSNLVSFKGCLCLVSMFLSLCLQRSLENYNSTLDESRSRADMLEAEVASINSDIDELQDKVRLQHIQNIY